jgi:hypothetical protein
MINLGRNLLASSSYMKTGFVHWDLTQSNTARREDSGNRRQDHQDDPDHTISFLIIPDICRTMNLRLFFKYRENQCLNMYTRQRVEGNKYYGIR